MPELMPLGSWQQEIQLIEHAIESAAPNDRPAEILEAGCGPNWPLNLNIEFRLTGIDLDAAALERRKNELNDLDECILGDLITAEFEPQSFDAIYCAYVLEHLERADTALVNFTKWLKPGGVMILRFPDRDSAQGFVVRHTPHWFHVAFYRTVLGEQNAGKPGYRPYVTHYHPVTSRMHLAKFCEENELEVASAYKRMFVNSENPFKKIFRFPLSLAVRTISAVSLGRLSHGHINVGYVLRKPQLPAT